MFEYSVIDAYESLSYPHCENMNLKIIDKKKHQNKQIYDT